MMTRRSMATSVMVFATAAAITAVSGMGSREARERQQGNELVLGMVRGQDRMAPVPGAT